MALEQSKGNPCSYKQAWRTLGAARAEAVGGEAEWVDPYRHGDVESPRPLPQELQEQVDALRAAEPEPGPDPESWKRQQEEGERRRREEARFAQRYEDEREILLGAYARQHRGIPRLEDDRGEGLPFINRLLPARDRVRFAEDSDEGRESAGAVPVGPESPNRKRQARAVRRPSRGEGSRRWQPRYCPTTHEASGVPSLLDGDDRLSATVP
ncbi:hypothetical protein V8E54_003514 [Elaphomyces granulatus]